MLFNFKHRQIVVLIAALAALMLSAVSVAYTVHLTRSSVGQLSALHRQQSALEVEWEKLLLEMNLLAGYNRIEANALKRLNMKAPNADQLRVIELKNPRGDHE